ncbi:MAG: c-type cytochrome domain-containing protein [Planctomycetota bacterium]|nr:c-type cytochrome domain-containing protein [Planctomycetota bacterium]
MRRLANILLLIAAVLGNIVGYRAHAEDQISYAKQVAPIFAKYCAGCHSGAEPDGDFSLESSANLFASNEDEEILVVGEPAESRLWQLISGEADPLMPPEDEPKPSEAERKLIRTWIEQGLQVDAESVAMQNRELPAASKSDQYIGAIETSQGQLYLGRLGEVAAWLVENAKDVESAEPEWVADEVAGKVNALRAANDGNQLLISSGVGGVRGEVLLVDADSGETVRRFKGHSDSVYCAALSPDGTLLASGSYDRKVIIWDAKTGEVIRKLTGHNGAIYDLDFDPTGKVLATASADQTVKLWNVVSGERLDTLGQPEAEMLCVRFSPDGKNVFAGGADRQIRCWQVVSRDKPGINPMLIARYAHESEILHLRILDGKYLASASSDNTVKLWNLYDLAPFGNLLELKDTPVGLATFATGEAALMACEIRGQKRVLPRTKLKELLKLAAEAASKPHNQSEQTLTPQKTITHELVEFQETEPNNSFADTTKLDLPATIRGGISEATNGRGDQDLYRFAAEAGQSWIIEAKAVGKNAKLDSFVDILDSFGEPVLRTRLQALRESYFTFRGKDSSTSDDYRLHKWEDMELDEYLYSGGEVNRLWLYPRGPDSGFKVYPGFGKRYSFFDTTPISHALGDVAYVVRELGRDEVALPNGLPVFPIYYENDDDGERRDGKNSRLHFDAPKTGDYFLRIRDARGFGGEDFAYEVKIRQPKPDFSITVSGSKMEMPLESGREWKVTAKRTDGFAGPISITMNGLPEGFVATNPLIIEAGQQTALGSIYATSRAQIASPQQVVEPEEGDSARERPDAKEPDEKKPAMAEVQLTARANVDGQEITHELKTKLLISLKEIKEVQLQLVDIKTGKELDELKLAPGQTISAKVVVQRNGTTSRIGFGKDDSGRNLPHGAFVDNIGLNGLLITEQVNEREFFITGAPKVPAGRRQFHLRADSKGNPTSKPVWIEITR